ncbi:MAG: type II toxin-antitoxin system RelE/ParE family toxin [Solirubrobacterales bacterium]
MAEREKYEIRVTPEAARQIRKLDGAERERLEEALRQLARDSADTPGSRGGKSLKRIRGRRDRFFRLRVGDMRVVFEVLKEERVLLVAGVVNRRDLERWLRSR